jgi:tetratricopeptide (TPR) repeat protein
MRARLLLGVIYERQDRIEEAIEEFEAVIRADADNHIALNALGYLFAEKGINLDRAELMIKKALEFQPDNGAYLDSLGWVYFRKGLIEKALTKLKRASGLLEDPVIFNHLGDVYFSKDDLDNAEENWKKSFEIDSSQRNIKQKIDNLKRLKSRR